MTPRNKYPINIEAVRRPFRIWHEQREEHLRWRNYAIPNNAKIGAWIEAKYECKVGETLTVRDIRNGMVLGHYTRRVKSVEFTKERTNGIQAAE
jgi:hypothetical protein